MICHWVTFWRSIHNCRLFRSKRIRHLFIEFVRSWCRLAFFLIHVTLRRWLFHMLGIPHSVYSTSISWREAHPWLFLRWRLKHLVFMSYLARSSHWWFSLVLMRVRSVWHLISSTLILCLVSRCITKGQCIGTIHTVIAIIVIGSDFRPSFGQVGFEYFSVVALIASRSSLSWLWP